MRRRRVLVATLVGSTFLMLSAAIDNAASTPAGNPPALVLLAAPAA